MDGLYLLLFLGVCCIAIFGYRESIVVTDNSPTTPPTRDAYDV